jgi:polyisoprenoid-binding protein YceI
MLRNHPFRQILWGSWRNRMPAQYRCSINRKDKAMIYRACCITVGMIAWYAIAASQAPTFRVSARGVQVFNTEDRIGRNQVTFRSKAPLEDIFGAAAGVSGRISFDPADVQGTIKGLITVQVSSMTTGLKQRDLDMLGENWLDVGRYRTITFKIRKLRDIAVTGDNELAGTASGDFTMHGVTKTISIPVTLKYLEESAETRLRGPGDLLVLHSNFSVRFEDYNVKAVQNVIGIRVARTIDLQVGIVGSNFVDPSSADAER